MEGLAGPADPAGVVRVVEMVGMSGTSGRSVGFGRSGKFGRPDRFVQFNAMQRNSIQVKTINLNPIKSHLTRFNATQTDSTLLTLTRAEWTELNPAQLH